MHIVKRDQIVFQILDEVDYGVNKSEGKACAQDGIGRDLGGSTD